MFEHLSGEVPQGGAVVDGAVIGTGDDFDVPVLTFGQDEKVELVDIGLEERDGLVEPEVVLITHGQADALLEDGAVFGGVFAEAIGDVVGAILRRDAGVNLAGLRIDECGGVAIGAFGAEGGVPRVPLLTTGVGRAEEFFLEIFAAGGHDGDVGALGAADAAI